MNLVKFSIDSLRRTRPAPQRTVEIGDIEYPTTEIAGKLWLAENLDLSWQGLKVGIPKTEEHCPKAWYYNNDQATNGWNGRKLGLCYNYYAVEYMKEHASDIFPGWHVATRDEWLEIIEANSNLVGDQADGRTALANGDLDWAPNWHGTNELNFNLKPNGHVYGGENFSSYEQEQEHKEIGEECWFWTATTMPSNAPFYVDGWYRTQGLSVDIQPAAYDHFWAYAVRLVHDY